MFGKRTETATGKPKGKPEVTDIKGPITGTCKWFGSSYGFFEAPGLADLFCHVTELPKEGDRFVRPADGSEVRFRYGKRVTDASKLAVVGPVEVMARRQAKAA